MAQTFLCDEIISLRAPEPEDLDMLYLWENDSSLWNVGNAVAPYSRKQLWEYIETYEPDIFKSRQLRFVITEKPEGKPVGTIDLYDFDPVNRHAFVGILLDNEYRKNGLAQRAVTLLCEYCRVHLGLHSLLAVTAVGNEGGLRLFRSCGFESCGCLRSWIRRGNAYEDAIILQCLFP